MAKQAFANYKLLFVWIGVVIIQTAGFARLSRCRMPLNLTNVKVASKETTIPWKHLTSYKLLLQTQVLLLPGEK